MANVVVEVIKEVVGVDVKNHLEGKIEWKDGCPKLQERGGVYGFAIELTSEEKEKFFNIIDNKNKKPSLRQWKSLKDTDFYPLYWGKDENLGHRLFEHTKSSKTVGTIQLDSMIDLFKNKTIIYGAVFCSNKEENEKKLIKNYPCILKTQTKK